MSATTTTRTRKPAKPAPAPAPAPEATPAAAPTICRCGCGSPTVRAEALYIAGHDARHAGQIGRLLIADLTDDEAPAAEHRLALLPTPALRAKAEGMVATAARKAAERSARKAAHAAAKAAADAARIEALRAAGF